MATVPWHACLWMLQCGDTETMRSYSNSCWERQWQAPCTELPAAREPDLRIYAMPLRQKSHSIFENARGSQTN
ncbi:uncharacterized [Tachysurus ichikawai]